jgi:hypothetical protein
MGRSGTVTGGSWNDANLAWPPATMARYEDASAGRSVAEADLLATGTSARGSFTPEAWTRLEDLRKRFDPEGRLASYLQRDHELSQP